MNYPFVLNQLGRLLVVFSAVMGLIAALAWLLAHLDGHGNDWQALDAILLAALVNLGAGAWICVATRECPKHLGQREALFLTALSWVVGAFFASLPYLVWATLFQPDPHPFRNPLNGYFEAVSGLTTTGATILSDIEAVPQEILLWRAFTHWIGGLGIVVLFVAVLPSLGVGSKRLYQGEGPRTSPEGLQPRIRDTATVLWVIYSGLTALEAILLRTLGGMTWSDAICHAFSTLASGGLSTRNASLGAYASNPAVDVIVLVFMVAAGLNFGLFFRAWKGRFRDVFRDTELRVYLAMLAVGSAIVVAALAIDASPIVRTDGQLVDASFLEVLRQGVFTTISVQTTTGFCTSDFNVWPFAARAVLVAMMFVGGCSGSTAGGIKVIRVWMLLRVLFAQVERFIRPRLTRPLRIGGQTVDDDVQRSTIAFFLGALAIIAVGWVLLMILEGCSSSTAATASVATFCTIGPGLDAVGAIENYGWFSAPGKAILCALMILGRLEVFAIVVLCRPDFWRRF